ncbi:hypothetical protein, partial [Yersinia rohdei]|uniref:hypothetical protein n=1 Tax=Yersinia rohdei TaxID=29485 RepID=UPI001C946E6B
FRQINLKLEKYYKLVFFLPAIINSALDCIGLLRHHTQKHNYLFLNENHLKRHLKNHEKPNSSQDKV